MNDRRYIPPEGAIAYVDRNDLSAYRITFAPVHLLRPHEQIINEKAHKMLEKIRRNGFFHKALLIDEKSYAILDGHHKWYVAQQLGLVRVPVICVDYLRDKNVKVSAWETSDVEKVRKKDVVAMALSDQVYAPKTSRHIVVGTAPSIYVPLSELGSYEKK